MHTDLFWIEGPWAGRLAIMPRPRGGDWLADEVRHWQRSGVSTVVSLLTAEEQAEFDLLDEGAVSRANGIDFIPFPVLDRSVPASTAAFSHLVTTIAERLAAGQTAVVHCRQGIGRAALVAICLLIAFGVDENTAITRVATARGCPVPETAEQRRLVTAFANSLAAPAA